MGGWFKKIVTALGPRAIGVGASVVSGIILAKTGQNVSPEKLVAIVGTMIGSYAGVHRISSVFMNPGDAASPTLAAVDSQIKTAAQTLPEGSTPTVPVVPFVPKPQPASYDSPSTFAPRR